MDKLQAMQIFTRIVDTNSFAKAADSLGLPRATVTTQIQSLEAMLGVRLLHRTTRRLSLTPDGAAYYERAVRILSDVEEAESAFATLRHTPRGRLRVDMPGSIGRLLLIPRIQDFHARYPEVELMIGVGDRPVDLIQEGVDCVIRAGVLQDSSLIARRIGLLQSVTCASPDYLERNGTPRTLEDLEHHRTVQYFVSRTGRYIDTSYVIDGENRTFPMRGSVAVNDSDAYITCGLEGLGLIQPPRFMALPYLRSGQLVEVLSQWRAAPIPVSAVYPHNRHLSPKVRVFVDWVAERFAECPLLMGQEVDEESCARTIVPRSPTLAMEQEDTLIM